MNVLAEFLASITGFSILAESTVWILLTILMYFGTKKLILSMTEFTQIPWVHVYWQQMFRLLHAI